MISECSYVEYSWRNNSKLDAYIGIPFLWRVSLLFQYLHEDNTLLCFNFKWAEFVVGETRMRKTIWKAYLPCFRTLPWISFCGPSPAGQPLLPCFASCNFVWDEETDKTVDRELDWSWRQGEAGQSSLAREVAFYSPQDMEPHPTQVCLSSYRCQKNSFPLGLLLICVISKSLDLALDKLPATSWTKQHMTEFTVPRCGAAVTELTSAREESLPTGRCRFHYDVQDVTETVLSNRCGSPLITQKEASLRKPAETPRDRGGGGTLNRRNSKNTCFCFLHSRTCRSADRRKRGKKAEDSCF